MSDTDANALDLTPTRSAGLARLAAFLPRAGRYYAANAHIDHGPERRGNVHALSPWLRSGLVTSDEAAAAVRVEHGAAGRAFEADLATRAERRDWLDARPELWRRQRLRVTALFRAMEKSATLLTAYDEAVEGRTGLNAFDAWAKELVTLGWLHPAARRAFASLWIFSLRLPWELGVDLFGRALVDAEPAEDLLLWREVAGLQPGTPGFVVAVEQIAEMSAKRFRPRLALVDEHARPFPADAVPPPETPDPPDPPGVLSGGRVGLLLTEANLSEGFWTGASPVALATLSAADLRSPWPTTDAARAFANGAIADAETRASAELGLIGETLDAADWTRALLSWSREHALDTILTGSAHVGPVAERLAAATRKLDPAGVQLAFRM